VEANLLVICSDYPIEKENAEAKLLSFQLKSINKAFNNIILLPTVRIKKENIIPGLRHSVIYNFRQFKVLFLFYFLNNIHFLFNDIQKIKLSKIFIYSFIKSFTAYSKSIFIYTFLKDYLKTNNLIHNTSIYSFWFNDFTLGALLLKKQYPNIKIFTGAHGHDLFPERHIGKRIPYRETSINLLDQVIVCSNEGIKYLKSKYPKFKNKFKLVNSGINKKNFKVKTSDDGIFRILTLSRTSPVKRISYLLNTLKKIESFSDFKIEYFHIGGDNVKGESGLQNLKNLSRKLDFNRFKITFLGKISDLELETFFKESPIDVFLNVSSSEGTCLSLVEAMSYSIPVVVTSVGGNITIGNISDTCLNVNFSPDELYQYLKKINNDEEYREKLQSNSYNYWSSNHNSDILSLEINDIFQLICK
jgi:colanic acid/amylovoran biosynthesis glycosyltransferase